MPGDSDTVIRGFWEEIGPPLHLFMSAAVPLVKEIARMDAELVTRAIRGDREALASLIELDQSQLYHFLRRRLDESDVLDAAQEVIRRVLSGLPTLRDVQAYRGWLYGIAIRVVKERSRSAAASRRIARTQLQRMKETAVGERGRLQIREQVRSALDALDDDLRADVLLRYEQGLSYQEIAQSTGRPVGTVSKRLHTARQRLLELLAGAGAVLAMSTLEEALAAATMGPLPEGFAAALRKTALESERTGSGSSFSPTVKILTMTVPLVLAGLVGLLAVRRDSTESLPVTESPRTARKIMPPERGRTATLPSVAMTPPSQEPSPVSRITGIVRDRESLLPISGARLWLSRYGFGAAKEVLAGPDGRFLIESPASREIYYLDAVAPGYVRRRTAATVVSRLENSKIAEDGRFVVGGQEPREEIGQVGTVVLNPGTEETAPIELLRSAELRGRIVDASGRPLVGARIVFDQQMMTALQNADASASFGFGDFPDGKTNTYASDFRGAFTISNLYPGGECWITISMTGYVQVRKTFALRNPAQENVIVLSQGTAVSGHLVGVGNQPLEGALVYAMSPGSSHLVAASKPTAKDGAFELRDLKPDTRFLMAFLPGFALSTADLREVDPERILISATEAAVTMSGKVTDERGQPLDGAFIGVAFYETKLPDGHLARVHFESSGELGGIEGNNPKPPGREDPINGNVPEDWKSPQTTSGSTGHFSLEKLGLRPGVSATFLVFKEGYEMIYRSASLGTDLGTITLRKNDP